MHGDIRKCSATKLFLGKLTEREFGRLKHNIKMNCIEMLSEAVDRIHSSKYKAVEGYSEDGNEG